ncbi:MAG: hypothetical protein ACKO04_02860 [Actinomycetes bacterium]
MTTSWGNSVRRTMWGAAAASLLAAAVLQFGGGTPVAGADPVSKTIAGTCTGADAATNGLLAALGGTSLSVNFVVSGDVPKSLIPGQTGATATFNWGVSLDQALVNKAVATGLTQMTIRNAKLDVGVSGPTSTTAVLGRPGDSVLNLALNTPATLNQGPFSAPLNDIGDSGVVNFKTLGVTFTISVALAGRALDLNIACATPALVASSPIKVAGAPEIVQPIEAKAAASAETPIDVLGQFVKPGRTPIVPSSLRVVDGPAKVVDGQLVVTAGAEGTTTSATFEVCGQPFKVADAVPGVSEVQQLTLDTNLDGFKRGIAFTLTSGEEETVPVWSAEPNLLGFFSGIVTSGPIPANWPDVVNNYALGTQYVAPSAATIQSALEALPSIGAGNVKVTKTSPTRPEYQIEYIGTKAEKDMPELKYGKFASVLPQETLEGLIGLAGSLGGSSGGPTTTLPDGLTAQQYIDRLVAEAGDLVAAGDFNTAGDKLAEAIRLSFTNALANINVQEVVGSLTAIFPSKPQVATSTPGTEPIAEQFQDLCAQGAAAVTVDAPVPPTTVAPPAPAPGPAVQGITATQGPAKVQGRTATSTGSSSLAVTGSSPVGLLVAAALLLLGGLVLGDLSRWSRRR